MTVISMFSMLGPEDEAGLRYAAGLAIRLDRPLKAICALPDPAMTYAYTGPEFGAGLNVFTVGQVTEAQEQLIAESKDAFERIMADVGLTGSRATFEHRVGLPERIAADAATLADAIVFPRPATQSGHGLSRALEFVLMDAALPVIVAGTSGRENGPILIAWDGSEQAARAVRGHAELIERLGHVAIAQNRKDVKEKGRGDADEPGSLEAWLKDRGVASETHAFEGKVGEGLLALADKLGAEMIVAGAYGHSRTGEFFFGGVTRTLMKAENVPALALCH